MLAGSKGQVPRARAISIATGFIETAIRPATSVFARVLGTIAANIRTTAPIHEISGAICRSMGIGFQWNTRPIATAVSTRYTSPRSSIVLGSRWPRRV